MAAMLAQGVTRLSNAAREPEISDLVRALQSMGAEIDGIDSSELTIRGISSARGMQHTIVADRVEAATFLCAGLITGGWVEARGVNRKLLGDAADAFVESGASLEETSNSVLVRSVGELRPIQIETRPFPGFPTDMQAQFMALLTQARGESRISENIFENRFMHVPELARLGAKIRIQGSEATVTGPSTLTGAIVMATDLRASASLILAGLAARSETIIRRIYHLDRGYEAIEQKLSLLGADIRREDEK
jgi:UDP-N-acetylglucosamine 1-carboxyvinyltransferase